MVVYLECTTKKAEDRGRIGPTLEAVRKGTEGGASLVSGQKKKKKKKKKSRGAHTERMIKKVETGLGIRGSTTDAGIYLRGERKKGLRKGMALATGK